MSSFIAAIDDSTILVSGKRKPLSESTFTYFEWKTSVRKLLQSDALQRIANLRSPSTGRESCQNEFLIFQHLDRQRRYYPLNNVKILDSHSNSQGLSLSSSLESKILPFLIQDSNRKSIKLAIFGHQSTRLKPKRSSYILLYVLFMSPTFTWVIIVSMSLRI